MSRFGRGELKGDGGSRSGCSGGGELPAMAGAIYSLKIEEISTRRKRGARQCLWRKSGGGSDCPAVGRRGDKVRRRGAHAKGQQGD